MHNTELTLDQLSEVAGGGVFAKLDGFKQVIHPNYRPRSFDIGSIGRRVDAVLILDQLVDGSVRFWYWTIFQALSL